MNHIDELAELYALGSLSEEEARTVNAHITTCDECRQRVNDAEKVVSALALQQAKVTTRNHAAGRRSRAAQLWPALGFAAGLILPLLFLLPIVLHARQSEQQTHAVFAALVNSHFNHVAFTPRTLDAPHAKLLYARTAEWLYVVALRPRSDLAVLLRSGHSVRSVGTLHANDSDAEVFVPHPGLVDDVLLVRGGSIVADAHPAFTLEVQPRAKGAAPR